jgi:hypothetical protein
MAQYNVMVPVEWAGSTNRFRVPVRFDGELTKQGIAEIKKVAVDYVISKGQALAEHGKIEIYRQPSS